jgi:hypothetical protein
LWPHLAPKRPKRSTPVLRFRRGARVCADLSVVKYRVCELYSSATTIRSVKRALKNESAAAQTHLRFQHQLNRLSSGADRKMLAEPSGTMSSTHVGVLLRVSHYGQRATGLTVGLPCSVLWLMFSSERYRHRALAEIERDRKPRWTIRPITAESRQHPISDRQISRLSDETKQASPKQINSEACASTGSSIGSVSALSNSSSTPHVDGLSSERALQEALEHWPPKS